MSNTTGYIPPQTQACYALDLQREQLATVRKRSKEAFMF